MGLCLFENVCLNHYLYLPNKVFEYMMAGLPMIVSDFPEMAALVERYDCGWKVTIDAEALLTLIKTISSKEISAKSANACGARCHFGWHLEEPTLRGSLPQVDAIEASRANAPRFLRDPL